MKAYFKQDFEKSGKPHDESFYEKLMTDVFRKSDHNHDGLISAKEYNVYEHDEL